MSPYQAYSTLEELVLVPMLVETLFASQSQLDEFLRGGPSRNAEGMAYRHAAVVESVARNQRMNRRPRPVV